MVLGIFFVVVFLAFLFVFYKVARDSKNRMKRLIVSAGCSLIVTGVVVFGAAKELAALKYLLH